MRTQTFAVDLTDDERKLLRRGLAEWGGPALCTDALAVVMGFDSVEDLLEQGRRLRQALANGEPLPTADWRRTLVATEFVFASDVFGAGQDWPITTGLTDEETIRILRTVQRKIARARHRSDETPEHPEPPDGQGTRRSR